MLLHPIVIHFPIAFSFFETFLIALGIHKKSETYRHFAALTFKSAFFLIFLAAATGFYDAGGIGKAWGVEEVREHLLAASSAIFFYVLRFFLWRAQPKIKPSVFLALAVLNSLAIAVTGFFGGELVYGD